MIKIITINNQFEAKTDRDIKEVLWQGKPLSAYIPPFANPVVSLNQKIVSDYSIIPADNSEIIISPRQEIPAVAGAFMSFFSSAFVTGAVSGYIAVGLSYVAAGAVIMAGSALLNSVLAPQAPSTNNTQIDQSPTYSWSQAKTLPRNGSVIPVTYGTNQLAGNIIQRRIEYVGDDEYLNLQLALCMGVVDVTDIKINDLPISNYSDVEYFTTSGTDFQDVMPYFGDIETPNNFSVDLADTAVVRTTIGNSLQALRLFINFPQGIYYQNDKGGLDSRDVDFKIEYKSTSSSTWIVFREHFTVKGSQTTPINREARIDGLTPDSYDVRITRLTAVSTNPREQTTSKWNGMGEIVLDDLYYPNVALLGLRIKATGQLSGSVNVLTICSRQQIEVYDETGSAKGLKNLDNPAWAYWDVLTNPIYGYGLPYSQIDFNAISEWADWCDELVDNGLNGQEKRAVFNGVFDFSTDVWTALTKIATVGRASPIIRGTKYSVIVDKSAQMVQLFNMGNMRNLKISYIGQEDLANEVEIQFINKDKNYTNDTITVVVPEWFNTDSQAKKTTIQQMGITNLSQAYRVGRYFLNTNKNLRRTAEFEVGVDALDSEVGDVVGISHNVPAWGQSGRIMSATTNTVNLGEYVDLNPSNSYKITVRHQDNTFETFDIIQSGGEVTTLTIDGNFDTIPSKYDIYSLIETPHTINLFRISSITRKDDLTRKIKAVEYNESIVSDDTTIIPQQSQSEFDIYPEILEIVTAEHLEKRQDGTIIPYIDLKWTIDNNTGANSEYALYLSKDGTNYQKVIEGLTDNRFEYLANNLEENKDYYFKVVAKSLGTVYNPNGLEKKHTFLGLLTPPPEVTNLQIFPLGQSLKLTWDDNKPVDFSNYEILHNGEVIGTVVAQSFLTDVIVTNGLVTFGVRSVDTSGNKSDIVYGTADITLSSVTSVSTSVIDNNVLIRWESVAGTLPIEHFIVSKGADYNTATEIGIRKGSFTTVFETQAGTYTYWITPVDTGGNIGAYKKTVATVSQPPDFILNVVWTTDWSGTKTNIAVKGDVATLPINTTETIDDHFTNWATPNDQVNAGYPLWLTPSAGSASYVEVFDYQTVLGSTTITITDDYSDCTVQISTSLDGSSYADHAVNQRQVFDTNIQYVKITYNFTVPDTELLELHPFMVRLDNKVISDSGNGTALASDSGGTVVTFNKHFVDITAISVTPNSTTAMFPIYDFQDVPNPTSFKVLLYDKDGTRVDGDFSWIAKGY